MCFPQLENFVSTVRGNLEINLKGAQVQGADWAIVGTRFARAAHLRLHMAEPPDPESTFVYLVDSFGNGWLKRPEDLDALLLEISTLIDGLVDFEVELRKLLPQQLEMFSEEERAL